MGFGASHEGGSVAFSRCRASTPALLRFAMFGVTAPCVFYIKARGFRVLAKLEFDKDDEVGPVSCDITAAYPYIRNKHYTVNFD